MTFMRVTFVSLNISSLSCLKAFHPPILMTDVGVEQVKDSGKATENTTIS